MRGIDSHDYRWLSALVAVAFPGFLFACLAMFASADRPPEFDADLLMALRESGQPDDPLGPRWLEIAARDLTALGSNAVLMVLVVCTCCYLVLRQNPRKALFVAFVVPSGMAMSFLLKAGFNRPRPDLVAHGTEVFTSSFPSSHAMASAVAFVTFGALFTRSETKRRERAFFFVAAAGIILLIGASRVYLGVHWPTDVIAGWAAGATWAILAIMSARKLHSHSGPPSATD